MKIVDIQERTTSIASSIRNAYIDFSKMTVSVVALVTDVMRDGKPVVGYGFNSNGRYAQGSLLRERFLPRVQRQRLQGTPSRLSEVGPRCYSALVLFSPFGNAADQLSDSLIESLARARPIYVDFQLTLERTRPPQGQLVAWPGSGLHHRRIDRGHDAVERRVSTQDC